MNPELRIVLALLAIALGVVVYLALSRGGSGPSAGAGLTQEQIDEALGRLQQDFQTALQEEHDLTRIAAQARAFTEAHPGEQGGFVLLAQARMGLRQWGGAYEALEAALELDGSGFELCKMAGNCAAKLGRIEQAVAHYEQAVVAAGDQADAEAYAALGRLHLSLDGLDQAEQRYLQAKEAHVFRGEETNYRHEAYAGLADVASVRGDYGAALGWVDKAIKMSGLDGDADMVGYHIQKARIYMDAGRDGDAVTMLNHTRDRFPQAQWRIEWARLRARLHDRAGELDKAVDTIQAITELHRISEERDDETIADFTALLAQWQIKAGRVDAARVSLHNLETLMPEHPAVEGIREELAP